MLADGAPPLPPVIPCALPRLTQVWPRSYTAAPRMALQTWHSSPPQWTSWRVLSWGNWRAVWRPIWCGASATCSQRLASTECWSKKRPSWRDKELANIFLWSNYLIVSRISNISKPARTKYRQVSYHFFWPFFLDRFFGASLERWSLADGAIGTVARSWAADRRRDSRGSWSVEHRRRRPPGCRMNWRLRARLPGIKGWVKRPGKGFQLLMGVSKMVDMENPIKMDDLGVPPFMENPMWGLTFDLASPTEKNNTKNNWQKWIDRKNRQALSNDRQVFIGFLVIQFLDGWFRL